MTCDMTSQNIDVSFCDTLYVDVIEYLDDAGVQIPSSPQKGRISILFYAWMIHYVRCKDACILEFIKLQ